MKYLTQFSHPMPYLLYLEWLLLGLLLILIFGGTILPEYWFFDSVNPISSVLLILAFAVLGIYLPVSKSLGMRIGFTFLEFLIIILILYFGGLRGLFLPYLVLVIRSCFLFNLIGQIIVAGIVSGLSMCSWMLLYRRVLNLQPRYLVDAVSSFGILFLIMFILSLSFILIMMDSLVREQKSRLKIEMYSRDLEGYTSLAKAQSKLKERYRIARDLHDSLGNSLTGINLQLEAALKFWKFDPSTSYELINKTKQLAVSSVDDLHAIVEELRIDDLLDNSLRNLVKKIKQWNQIDIQLVIDNRCFVPPQIEKGVYQIVQEAMNNILKHAQANQVQILVETSEVLSLTVQDNGQGFRVVENKSGFGLKGIRERCDNLGGVCKIHSIPGEGTTIKVIIPLLPKGA